MQSQQKKGANLSTRDPFYSRMGSGMMNNRFSSRSNSPLNKSRISLIDTNDLDLPEIKNDLYQLVLDDHYRHTQERLFLTPSRSEILLPITQDPPQTVQFGKIDQQLTSEMDETQSTYTTQKNTHQCNCTQIQCNQQHCSCYLYPNEPCIVGLCCPRCIRLKNEFIAKQKESKNFPIYPGCLCKTIKCLKLYCTCFRQGRKCNPYVCKCQGCENDVSSVLLRKQRRLQLSAKNDSRSIGTNNQQDYFFQTERQVKSTVTKQNYSFINCSCKKSHCLKKYCSCLMHNKSCSQACACKQCQNTYDQNDQRYIKNKKSTYQRKATNYRSRFYFENNPLQGKIDQYLQKDDSFLENQEMHEKMEFEPVNFDGIAGY